MLGDPGDGFVSRFLLSAHVSARGGNNRLDRCAGSGWNDILACCGRRDTERVGFRPKFVRYRQNVDAGTLPPQSFVTGAVDLAMMSAAERYSELVADLEAKATYLREA
jgi:hypothetical protein